MEEGEKGVTGGQRGSSEGARKRQKHRWRTIRKGAETKHLKGNSLESGQDKCQGRNRNSRRAEGKKETDKPTKMETPKERVGSGNWMQMDGELFVVAKL